MIRTRTARRGVPIVFKPKGQHTALGRKHDQVNAIAEATGTGGGRTQHVLVVDDEMDILDSVKSLIESTTQGVEVSTAPSGPDALKALQDTSFDLIITDYKMPEMNGLEFLAEARRIAPRTARVMLTAFPDLDLALSALNDERIEKFLVKPIEPEELLKTVQEILDKRRHAVAEETERARELSKLRRRPESES